MIFMAVKGVSFGYGGKLLLDCIDLNIKFREKICLIGRNGVGKTTLMNIISGFTESDSGNIWTPNSISYGYLTQNIPSSFEGNAFQVICDGLGRIGKAILMNRILEENSSERTSFSTAEYEVLQRIFDVEKGWLIRNKIEAIISKMSIPDRVFVNNLSIGMQRRVLLARVIVAEPDLLLLDEPTNHMDLQFIEWLETFLLKFKKTLIFTTHDRSMVRALATRIVEIDRGKVVSWDCGYNDYLRRKENSNIAEEQRERNFDRKMEDEENWIRRGVKARRVRNEGRIKALKKMRELRRHRQNKIGKVKANILESEYGGKLVIELENVVFYYKTKLIIKKLSYKIMQGDRIGIIGPNGCGKTTLVQLLLKHIAPDFGLVRHGTRLDISYFDQCRIQLDVEKSARENVFDGNDIFVISGKRRHVVGYLRDFLFSPERTCVPVKFLSGGEKNRLLLAKLFTKPANLLVLDEPTNDLDLETLELLEELLIDYKGTILLVSHDRSFLENVVTNMLIFDAAGEITSFVGGYSDWYDNYFEVKTNSNLKPKLVNAKGEKRNIKNKISYKEKCELENLPDKIETLEKQQQRLFDIMAKSDFYRQENAQIISKKNELIRLQERIGTAYARWEFLEFRDQNKVDKSCYIKK